MRTPSEKKEFAFLFEPGMKKSAFPEKKNGFSKQEEIRFDHELDIPLTDVRSEYSFGSVFAEGGQGLIREADDLSLHRLVAIKSLKMEFNDTETRNQFIQEARITAQMSHPAIVPIYSLNTDCDDGLHLSMKLLEGKTLKRYLEQIVGQYRTSGAVAYDEHKSLMTRLEIFLRVCDALEYANSRNIMHCDLKPENIQIGKFGETYVMDWGIARLIKEPDFDPEKWVRPTSIAGTPRFLSPEAVQGEHTDQRADIYALGLILFEITTLKEAYTGQSTEEVVSLIRRGCIAETKHRFGCRIAPDLKAIIAKATAYNRNERYQTVRELSSDLRNFLVGKETSANPYHFPGRFVSYAVLHKRLSFFFALLIILSLILLFALTCYRQITQITGEQMRSQCISKAYTQSSLGSNYIESRVANSAQSLSAIISEYLFLSGTNLEIPGVQERKYFSTEDLAPDSKTAPKTHLYSPVYQRKVDFSNFAYKTMKKGELTQEDKKRIETLGTVQDLLIQTFHGFLPDFPDNSSKNEKEEYLRITGIPLYLVLFGFPDGFFAVYPGNGNYAESYDPRARQWYKISAASKGEAVWTKPYRGNTYAVGYLLSCIAPMLATDGTFVGIAGFDLRINSLIRELKDRGNTGNQVLEKTLIDRNGVILFSTAEYFAKAMEANQEDYLSLLFENETMVKDITNLKYGVIPRTEHGREVLYCVNYIPSQVWYYIEKIDLGFLLQSATREEGNLFPSF